LDCSIPSIVGEEGDLCHGRTKGKRCLAGEPSWLRCNVQQFRLAGTTAKISSGFAQKDEARGSEVPGEG
jgi:hypothetical protein